jgi:hypothetical protein
MNALLRPLAVTLFVAFAGASLGGCVGAMGALHGVGASGAAQSAAAADAVAAPQVAAPVLAANGVRQDAVTLARAGRGDLEDGVALNIAADTRIQAGPPPPAPELGANREQAIGQIRQKASGAGKTKPDVFQPRYASAAQLSAAEQAALEAEMARDVAATQGGISAKEAAAREAAALRLKRRAATHYNEALSSIEK